MFTRMESSMDVAASCSSEHLNEARKAARQDRNRQLFLAALVAVTIFVVIL